MEGYENKTFFVLCHLGSFLCRANNLWSGTKIRHFLLHQISIEYRIQASIVRIILK